MARDSNAHDFIGSGAVLLVIVGGVAAAVARGGPAWAAWTIAGVGGSVAWAVLLIGLVAKGVQVSRVPLGAPKAPPPGDDGA